MSRPQLPIDRDRHASEWLEVLAFTIEMGGGEMELTVNDALYLRTLVERDMGDPPCTS